ncbi:hypothetical protein DFH94DRAFT_784376 [Russula ochroleuca]|uniref:HNH nuclease domain-containing protein n=1 Tax=Russula ochroleuca TaxID=152965 RepID=A0A9P5MPK6_9AGAM|nr:hypothetical protein DFH94DRAFT_784376 [Russula ochroleuca]
MSLFLPRSDSAESIVSVLTCASDEFQNFYDNESLNTEILSDEALRNIIRPNSASLRAADNRYRLDDLLSAMLMHAPHPSGKRYVAICLHIAHGKGEDGVVNAAKAWLDNLFLPMLAISKAIRTNPASSQTPDIDTTMQHIESASRAGQRSAAEQRALRDQVARRERYFCAITKLFDKSLAEKLVKAGHEEEIPDAGQHRMEAAHIIPFLLNKFDDKAISSPEITNAARTWDMLRSWTRIDFKTLIGSNINSPSNAIYMSTQEHSDFGHFLFYLDKEAYPDNPNKYKVRTPRKGLRLSSGLHEVDVEFPTQEESSIEPPNPEYLKVHAAFAKVLHLSGAAEYIESVERDAEMEGTLRMDGETDFSSYLQSKLTVMAY